MCPNWGFRLLDWFLQLTLFVGLLVLNQRREDKKKASCLCCIKPSRPDNKCYPAGEKFDREAPSGLQVFMSTTFPKALLSPVGKTFVFAFTIVWLGLSIWAAPKVEVSSCERPAAGRRGGGGSARGGGACVDMDVCGCVCF